MDSEESQIDTKVGESYDVIVVGAGWYGLAAARAYIQRHPYAKLGVLEAAESCGGTWSRDRLYPGLKSSNVVGTFEYPDFPMSEETYGLKIPSHIPGAVLFRYLTDYAKHFSVFDRIQFSTRVVSVQPNNTDGWRLSVVAPTGSRSLDTDKLIVATGLTSIPNMPSYHGQETFKAPLFHVKDYCKKFQSTRGAKNAVVIGGAKSAFDVAYALVEDGTDVDMVIRPNGRGPVWISPAIITPFKKLIDRLFHVRWMSWFSPCPWGSEDGFPRTRHFLHRTGLGRFLVDTFWRILGSSILSANRYDAHPEVEKLKPWHSAFWIGSRFSSLSYDNDIFEYVRQGKIRVHVDEVQHLEHKKVILSSGQTLKADTLICATGWKQDVPIKFNGLGQEGLGLPYSEYEMRRLEEEADYRVIDMFPNLANQPNLPVQERTLDPLRYYRFIVPSSSAHFRNLAFAGMVSSLSTPIIATVQGLWISTFFDGNLDRWPGSEAKMTDEIMLHCEWGKWRYPCGYGANIPDLAYDGLSYANLLMRDMGLRVNRKKTVFSEITSPYMPSDFKGLADEWEAKHEHERDEYIKYQHSATLKLLLEGSEIV